MIEHSVSQPADHAGVRVPPPLLYLLFFGFGLILQQLLPFSVQPLVPARVVALFFLAGGVLLVGWSNLLFRRTHTSLVPIKPSTALVVSGPYRLTRNPMYLGLLFGYIAVGLWLNLTWVLILVPLVVLAVQRLAIVKEERYLDRKFGEAYRQYRVQTRRWI